MKRLVSRRAATSLALAAVVVVATLTAGVHRHDRGASDRRDDPLVEATGGALVEIRDHAFQPGNLRVPRGSVITWINRDREPHTATAFDGWFDTGILGLGESSSIVMDTAGIFEYRCLPHPFMLARVEVVTPES